MEKSYNSTIKFLTYLFALLILFAPLTTYASTPIIIEYFGVDGCLTCVRAERHMDEIISILEDEGKIIELIKYDIKNEASSDRLTAYNNHHKIEGKDYRLYPAVFIGDEYMIDYEDIKNNFENTLRNMESAAPPMMDGDTTFSENSLTSMNFALVAVFVAGLIDGINPCSIAMMLFFISLATSSENNKKHVLKIGLSFSLGVFLAYFGIGMGVFNFIYSFSNVNALMMGVYVALSIMSIVIIALNVSDFVNIRRGREEKIKNQLSKDIKKRIHTFIKKNNNEKRLIFTAFIIAFVISFMEFFCTGQIYLPTITYMINQGDMNYVVLLLLYNLAFILPLLIITLLLKKGMDVLDVSGILFDKLHIIKLIGIFFFVFVLIYSIRQILLII